VLGVIQDTKPKLSNTLDLTYPGIQGLYRYTGSLSALPGSFVGELTQKGKLAAVFLPTDDAGQNGADKGIVAVIVPNNADGRYYTHSEFMDSVKRTKEKITKINEGGTQNELSNAGLSNIKTEEIDTGKKDYAYSTLWHLDMNDPASGFKNKETFLESVSQVYVQGRFVIVMVLNRFSSQKDIDWNISTTKTFIEKLHDMNQDMNILGKFMTMNRAAQMILVSMAILGVWSTVEALRLRRRARTAQEKE